jgi:hypothetical protein
MRVEYIVTYDAPFDQELFDKLATTAQTHINPYTNGKFMGIDAQKVEWRENGKETVEYLTPPIRLN